MKGRAWSGLGGKLHVPFFMLPARMFVFLPKAGVAQSAGLLAVAVFGRLPWSRAQVAPPVLQLLGGENNSLASKPNLIPSTYIRGLFPELARHSLSPLFPSLSPFAPALPPGYPTGPQSISMELVSPPQFGYRKIGPRSCCVYDTIASPDAGPLAAVTAMEMEMEMGLGVGSRF